MKYKIRKMGNGEVLAKGETSKAITCEFPVVMEWVSCFDGEVCITVSENALNVTHTLTSSFIEVS